MTEDDTEQLRAQQVERAREEKRRADEAETPPDERQHGRRAERADYLAEKLVERAKSEERAEDDA